MNCRLVLNLHAVGRDHDAKVTVSKAKGAVPVQKALQLDAEIDFVDDWRALVQMGRQLEEDPCILWLPLGLNDPHFISLLTRAIKSAASPQQMEKLKDGRIFVAGGVGAVAQAINRAFGNVVAVAAAKVGKLREALKKAGIRVISPPHTEAQHAVPTVRGYDSVAFDAVANAGSDPKPAIVWNVAGGPVRQCDLVAPDVGPEDIRSEKFRQFQQAVYTGLASSLKNPEHRMRLARLVPDAIARRVFAAYVCGKKGDPLIPSAEEFNDDYRDAILKQMRVRGVDFDEKLAHAALLQAGKMLSGSVTFTAANGAEPGDVPSHVMQRLRERNPSEASALAWFVRYASLGALGHQMAMPDAPKKLIVDAMGGAENVAELFASAVNATLPSYFSMFEDIEKPFGSLGAFGSNFLRKTPLRCFVANPPYDEAMLKIMVDTFLAALEKEPVTIAFGMPRWDDFEPLTRVKQSAFLQAEILFADKEVSWINYDILGTKTSRARIPAHYWFLLSSAPESKKFKGLGTKLKQVWVNA